MGDLNEVRSKEERYGSCFNVQGATAFNHLISIAGLVKVPLGGCSFTWCHKSATKMSKLHQFLISEGMLGSCQNISAITLVRLLLDHRPILLREVCLDYDPILFRFYHYWFELEGFDNFIKETWRESYNSESNAMVRFMNKLKFLKEKIRPWVKNKKQSSKHQKISLKEPNKNKMIWVKWSRVLASKEKRGLDVSSFFALNRALMFKWVWRFRNDSRFLWARVIKAIHGEEGNLGNGADTLFWEKDWKGDMAFKYRFPRVYAFESNNNISVAEKLASENLGHSLRRIPRDGAEIS
nr:RNA-directed DNA polymerase, eukaryota [Tanacetum cinerariifolium]